MDIQAFGQTVRQPVVERTRDVGAALVEGEEKSALAMKAPVFDEYVPEDPTVKQSAGIYEIIHEEDGTPKVRFDAPEEEAPKEASPDKEAPESKAETTTCNTDEVDRELEKLRKEQERLKTSLRQASGDPDNETDLERELSQVEQELQQKDNDAYRLQHAKFS